MVYTEKLETKVSEKCDVLVCGGGFAGIAAALAAARQGKKVILTERVFMLGGLGTAGLVTVYLPLCDGLGHQLSFGIAEELLKLSVSMGNKNYYPENWLDSDDPAHRTEKDKRFEAGFNAQLFAILAEKLLLSEGVKILYGTTAVSVIKEDKKIKAVIVENKSGRSAIEAKSFVDATGDADLVHFAGAPEETFKQGNILAAWYYRADEKGYRLKVMGACDLPDKTKEEEKKSVKTLIDRRFTGLDAEEISEFVSLAHGEILKDVTKLREKGSPELVPATIATIPQLRMTRRISGKYTLDDTETHKYFPDSVGMVCNWRKRGPAYEVPLGTLYSEECDNLICAGRCTSVTEPMWDLMRVIPCCSVTGEAAGTAAAMIEENGSFASLDVSLLQKKLRENGVKLHLDEVGIEYKNN